MEVTDPHVVAITDLVFLVDAGQAETESRGSDLILSASISSTLNGGIGHDVVGLAQQVREGSS